MDGPSENVRYPSGERVPAARPRCPGYHFLIPFFVNSSCDLIIENPLFKYVHVLVLFLMTVPMLLSVGFSVERIVAMALAHKYEHIRTFLGPLLVVFLVSKKRVPVDDQRCSTAREACRFTSENIIMTLKVQ
uniref:Uncharacterized protein n=1 Tax=Caenorhabditis japonica TaxID=281687 RepID=A0A8R1EGI0_CAEJA